MADEQSTEISTGAVDLEFMPTDTNKDTGVQNKEVVMQKMDTALMALVANSRKNPLEWRRQQKRYDPTTGG